MEQSKSFPPQLPIPQKEEEEQEKGKYSLVEIQKDSSVIQKKTYGESLRYWRASKVDVRQPSSTEQRHLEGRKS